MSATQSTGGLVLLASYPKSGNTWFRILRANLLSESDAPVDIDTLPEPAVRMHDRESFDRWTLIDSSVLRRPEADALRPAVCKALAAAVAPERPWVKVHDRWRMTPVGEPMFAPPAVCAVIYLARDPRDVAVSMAHHGGIDMDTAVAHLNSGRFRLGGEVPSPLDEEPGDWSTHVTGWLDQTAVPVHLVKYEDLKADPAEEFSSALRFLGESHAPDEIGRAVRFSSFSEMQKQETNAGFRERVSAAAPFFRRGQPGAWRDELTPTQADRLVENHAVVMRRLGYVY